MTSGKKNSTHSIRREIYPEGCVFSHVVKVQIKENCCLPAATINMQHTGNGLADGGEQVVV